MDMCHMVSTNLTINGTYLQNSRINTFN